MPKFLSAVRTEARAVSLAWQAGNGLPGNPFNITQAACSLAFAIIASPGTFTGASEDPAREFGPAVISGRLSFLWIYLLVPMAAAVGVPNLMPGGRTVLTHRLCGTNYDGSPLKVVTDNSG